MRPTGRQWAHRGPALPAGEMSWPGAGGGAMRQSSRNGKSLEGGIGCLVMCYIGGMRKGRPDGVEGGLGVVCPECGGDVGVTRQHRRGMPFFAGLVILILLLAMLIYLSPWVQGKLGDRFAVRDSIPTQNEPEFDELTWTISRSMLLGAQAGGAESREIILQQLMSQLNEYDQPGEDLLCRFVFAKPEVTVFLTTVYGCAGAIWSKMQISQYSNTLADPPARAQRYLTDMNRVRLWPYQRTRVLDTGGTMVIESLMLLGICSTLAVAIGVVWLLAMLDRRYGQGWLDRFSIRAFLFGIVVIGFAAWSGFRPHSLHYRSVQGAIVSAMPWDNAGELQGRAQTPKGRDELFGQLVAAVPASDAPVILTTQWKRNFTPRWRSWRWGSNWGLELLTVRLDSFYQAPSATQEDVIQIPIYIAHTLPQLRRFGLAEIQLRFGMHKNLWDISLYPANWVLIIASGILGWRLIRFVIGIPRRRVQRKRVKRDQCIFCGYPLSPQALAARSGGVGS